MEINSVGQNYYQVASQKAAKKNDNLNPSEFSKALSQTLGSNKTNENPEVESNADEQYVFSQLVKAHLRMNKLEDELNGISIDLDTKA